MTIWVETVGNEGATFTSLTMTVKLLVALNGGVPLSVTLTRIVLVAGLCVWAGVHEMIPVVGLFVMPLGAETRANVSVWPMSGSVALLVTVSSVNSSTV